MMIGENYAKYEASDYMQICGIRLIRHCAVIFEINHKLQPEI